MFTYTDTFKPVGTRVTFNLRRHLLPPFLGLAAMAFVFGLVNSQLVAARVHYFLQPPANSAIVLETQTIPSPKSNQIIIPAINVQAPLVLDEPNRDEASVQRALERGVLHYSSTVLPGEKGNAVLFGHSSGQPWAPGAYKFIFTLLDKVKPGQKVYVDYNGTQYIYEVEGSKVVPPTNLDVLKNEPRNTLTLITCSPVGTSLNRLVVTARQISPIPDNSPGSSTSTRRSASPPSSLPGDR